jgi:hypothetical protein
MAATDRDAATIETMWAIPQDDGTYIVDNSPFETYGISVGDKISVESESGELRFKRVVLRGGHSTYRVKLNKGADHSHFLKYWPQLALFGCSYEGMGGLRRLYSIDVPNSSSVDDVYKYLEEVEMKGGWEFEEAHYFDPSKSEI